MLAQKILSLSIRGTPGQLASAQSTQAGFGLQGPIASPTTIPGDATSFLPPWSRLAEPTYTIAI